MNMHRFSVGLFGLASVALMLMYTGCSTPVVKVSRVRSGEIKLTGVSKLAVVRFNTLPDDPFTGFAAADDETIDAIQQAVSAALYQTKFFEVADLGMERDITAVNLNAKPDARFDAFVCGRVWWVLSPEYRGEYPRKEKLETWRNIPYYTKAKDPFTGKEKMVQSFSRVTVSTKEVLETQYYRERHATLMLSLGVYRIDGNGEISKIFDTLEVVHEAYVQDNGALVDFHAAPAVAAGDQKEQKEGAFSSFFKDMKKQFVDAAKEAAGQITAAVSGPQARPEVDTAYVIGPRVFAADQVHRGKINAANGSEAAGEVNPVAMTYALPTARQAKMMAVSKVSSDVVARMSPTREILEVVAEFDDEKLFHMLDARAYRAAKEYIVKRIRLSLGDELAARVDPISSYPPGDYEVPPSRKPEKYTDAERFNDLLRDNMVHEYLFALGICEEATGKADQALYTYRFAFNIEPEPRSALGISRCIDTLGNAARVKEQKKAVGKATDKASLD